MAESNGPSGNKRLGVFVNMLRLQASMFRMWEEFEGLGGPPGLDYKQIAKLLDSVADQIESPPREI
jgi:hypothetical protein